MSDDWMIQTKSGDQYGPFTLERAIFLTDFFKQKAIGAVYSDGWTVMCEEEVAS